MSKNVLIVSTSLRSGSNSEVLADSFFAGAKATGHHVEKVTLKGKNMAFCQGCLICQKTKQCIIHDDAVELTEKMCHADVIAFATPIYYYNMSGQMKTLIDRANPLFVSDYQFRDIYMLTTAAEDDKTVPEKAIEGLQGWIDCFENAALAGTVFAGGVNDSGEIQGHPALQQAYDMGAAI